VAAVLLSSGTKNLVQAGRDVCEAAARVDVWPCAVLCAAGLLQVMVGAADTRPRIMRVLLQRGDMSPLVAATRQHKVRQKGMKGLHNRSMHTLSVSAAVQPPHGDARRAVAVDAGRVAWSCKDLVITNETLLTGHHYIHRAGTMHAARHQMCHGACYVCLAAATW
jgi:hypothetical protein